MHNDIDISFNDLLIEENIQEILQTKIDKLTEQYWKNDSCKPDFIISILHDNNLRDKRMEQYLILTCQHLNSCVSSVIFPIDKNYYGYDSLLNAMKSLYNRTM
jgi:hypothetical protein